MKRNFLKRIGAVALAVAVSLTMGVTSFAASTSDTPNATGGIESTDTTLNIPKGITVEGTLSQVYGPTVTYTYTIASQSVEAGTNVNDGTTTVSVNAGVADGVTLANSGQVVFNSSEVSVGEITNNLVANVDISKFSTPGIYRYVITDTTATSDLYNAGITRPDDYDKTRYLDVYIRSGDSGLEVYGYVLQSENTKNTTKDSNSKSQGYIAASESNKTDSYQTIDVTIEKTIDGAMADKGHQFPFAVAVSNDSHYYYAATGSSPTVNNDTNAVSASVSLGNGTVYYMTGLSPRATVTYTETNDTADTYTVTIKDAEGNVVNGVSAKQTAPNATQTTGELKVSNYTTDNSTTSVAATVEPTANQTITVLNELDEISPTNVVMRFAPFLFIFGAAILLLVVMRRRKTQDAE